MAVHYIGLQLSGKGKVKKYKFTWDWYNIEYSSYDS